MEDAVNKQCQPAENRYKRITHHDSWFRLWASMSDDKIKIESRFGFLSFSIPLVLFAEPAALRKK